MTWDGLNDRRRSAAAPTTAPGTGMQRAACRVLHASPLPRRAACVAPSVACCVRRPFGAACCAHRPFCDVLRAACVAPAATCRMRRPFRVPRMRRELLLTPVCESDIGHRERWVRTWQSTPGSFGQPGPPPSRPSVPVHRPFLLPSPCDHLPLQP